jgi:hypothetical protein
MSEGLWGGLTEAHSNLMQSCLDYLHAVPICLSVPYYDPAIYILLKAQTFRILAIFITIKGNFNSSINIITNYYTKLKYNT